MKRLLLPLVLLAACTPGREPGGLTATLISPTDVSLAWQAPPGVAGQAVEYAHEPGGEFTVLHFAPPGQTAYHHPDLIPETPFYYRVRPYSGPASETADVALPPGDALSTEDSHTWAEPRKCPGGANPVRSDSAKPTGFTAEVKHANGILFTWTENAEGEQGYLLEVRAQGARDYAVAAALDPGVCSFGLITLPTEKNATYRVRAYYYGEPTNIVLKRTGSF